MKNKLISKTQLPKIAAITIIITVAVFFAVSFQQPDNKEKGQKVSVENYYKFVTNIDTAHPLIIWKKPGTTEDEFNQWLKNHFSEDALKHKTVYCKNCDDDLLQLSGPEAIAYLSGQTVPDGRGGTKPKGSGGDGPAFYSINFKVNIPEYREKEQNAVYNKKPVPPQTNPNNNSPVTVAVFDTGLEPGLIGNNSNYRANVSPAVCFSNSEHGWNFPGNNYNVVDDHASFHGTIVTGFILEEGLVAGSDRIQILSVKAFAKDGTANLFHILCGLAYASKCKVKVVNASFGYYSMSTTDVDILFKEYINTYLMQHKILMICAAGNEDAEADRVIPNRFGCRPVNKRNLNINPFYPACFSKELTNVITVTTVGDDNTISPLQNFSPSYVDIGVICDRILNQYYFFENPSILTGPVTGSSFATPIVAGKICAHYSFLTQNGSNVDKTQIIRQMLNNNPPLLHTNSSLSSVIKGGQVMRR